MSRGSGVCAPDVGPSQWSSWYAAAVVIAVTTDQFVWSETGQRRIRALWLK